MSKERKKPGVGFLAAVLLAAGLLLYVASFGPARMAGVYYGRPSSTPGFTASFTPMEMKPWFKTLYKPLLWAMPKPWAKPLWWYWNLFPIPRE